MLRGIGGAACGRAAADIDPCASADSRSRDRGPQCRAPRRCARPAPARCRARARCPRCSPPARPCTPPKCASSAWRFAGADAGDLLQRRRRARLRAPRAVALDREAMRLVADLLQQVQARMVRRQVEHRIAVRERRCPPRPALRSGPLAMPISGTPCRPCSASTLGRDADLALAAVDHQQIGRRVLAGHDARAAPRQRLAHRRVVVARLRPASR